MDLIREKVKHEKACIKEVTKVKMNTKRLYGYLLQAMSAVAGIDTTKKFDTYFRFKKRLNLKNPQTLSDKVSYIELHEQSPLALECADKYAVREYVRKKGLADILIPVFGEAWNRVEDVDFDKLPNCFVLKATHGCKMNYIVLDKDKLDIEKCKQEMQKWLDTTYGTFSVEPHYTCIPHRIYAEQYLQEANELVDYKFHCMNGQPQFVLTCSNRKSITGKAMQVTLDLFDMQWKSISALVSARAEVPGKGVVPKPKGFAEMVKIAQRLSEDFKFVRVDLYELEEKIYFGELTFSPACGVFPYFTKKFDTEMGRLLNI